MHNHSKGLLRARLLLHVSVEKLCHSSMTKNGLSPQTALKKEVGLKY